MLNASIGFIYRFFRIMQNIALELIFCFPTMVMTNQVEIFHLTIKILILTCRQNNPSTPSCDSKMPLLVRLIEYLMFYLHSPMKMPPWSLESLFSFLLKSFATCWRGFTWRTIIIFLKFAFKSDLSSKAVQVRMRVIPESLPNFLSIL